MCDTPIARIISRYHACVVAEGGSVRASVSCYVENMQQTFGHPSGDPGCLFESKRQETPSKRLFGARIEGQSAWARSYQIETYNKNKNTFQLWDQRFYVETHLWKLCVILRSRLFGLCVLIKGIGWRLPLQLQCSYQGQQGDASQSVRGNYKTRLWGG